MQLSPVLQMVLAVRAVGLNFRDVLNVLGMYPGDPGEPGGDVAGTVVAVGSAVRHLHMCAAPQPNTQAESQNRIGHVS